MSAVKTRPFKLFYCDRPEVFRLPPAAFKLWFYHYRCEGKNRESWPSLDRLCSELDMNRKTVIKARKFLIAYGWLEKVGDRDTDGQFSVPVMKVKRGTLPEKQANQNHRVPKSGPRCTGPKKWATDRVQKTDPEVDTKREVVASKENIAAAADLIKQMEELKVRSAFKYYSETFDKQETLTPSRMKMGVERLREMRKSKWRNHEACLKAVIDQASEIISFNKKKAYLANWHAMFSKPDTFFSLLEQFIEES